MTSIATDPEKLQKKAPWKTENIKVTSITIKATETMENNFDTQVYLDMEALYQSAGSVDDGSSKGL